MQDQIRPVALRLGLPAISWHSFRHSLSRWAKRALTLEEAKTLIRHQNVSTTSEIYGTMSLADKRLMSHQLEKYIKQEAKGGGWRFRVRAAVRRLTDSWKGVLGEGKVGNDLI